MNLEEVIAFCIELPGTKERIYLAPSNIHSFMVGKKIFAYFKTSEPERYRFSVRVTPTRFIELTDQTGIKPARYRHRYHWVSILKVNTIHEEYLKELISWSYHKALSSLSKKEQQAIQEKLK